MTEEEWRPIPGYGGYEASDLGRVRSVTRKMVGPCGRPWTLQGRVRVLTPGWKGYLDLTVRVDGVRKNRGVHQLVALAFLGPRPESATMVCHRDGDNTNNVPENLYWGDQFDNERDKRRHGTHHYGGRSCCSRGHELSAFNLRLREKVVNGRRYEERICVACSRARNYCRDGADADQLQAVSDELYAKIQAGDKKLCTRGHDLAITRRASSTGCRACSNALQYLRKKGTPVDPREVQEVSDRHYRAIRSKRLGNAA